MKTLLLLLTLAVLISAVKETFHGHQVVRLNVANSSQQVLVDKLVEQYRLDVWSDYLNDVRLPPHLQTLFKDHGIEQTIFVQDVQRLIDEQESANNLRAPGEFFDAYRTSGDVTAWVNALKAQFPDLITTQEIGKTYSGKPITAVHLRSSKGTDKPRIIYNSCQHAREWVTITTNNWVLNELVQGYGKNETLTELVDKIDWTFIPIVNVDGYDFTWSNNRMWRKTRKPNPGSSCVGVDPNRNWPYMWNRGGSSNDPCNDAYHGPTPGSESEPMALANFVKNTPRVMGYMDIHSYSQLFMSPWGYITTLPRDYNRMIGLMTPIVNAIRGVHGRRYVEGNIASTIYVASGSSVDYTYGELGVVYSFAVELRDTGQYGFVLPPNQIKPQGEEFLAGVIVMANAIKTEWYSK